MINKIKNWFINAYYWIRRKIKSLLIALGIVGVALAAPAGIDKIQDLQTPAEYRLKAPIERIGPHKLIKDRETNEEFIIYAYRSENPSQPFENEVLEKRRISGITQKIGQDKYISTSFLGQKFYKEIEEGNWYDVFHAKTTPAVWNRKMKTGFIWKALAADTGWKNPSATGDDYNQWTDPQDAYTSNNWFTSPDYYNYKQDYYNFSFGVPAGATIDGIEASFEYTGGDYAPAAKIYVELSWNGGTNYTTSGKVVSTLLDYPTETTDTLGGSSDTWGRSWSQSEFSNTNFRLKINNKTSPDQAVLDHIKVKVYYTEGEAERRIIITQ